MTPDHSIRTFREADFLVCKSWHEHENVSKFLGELDEEWLSHVLKDKGGIQYVLVKNEVVRGAIGVTFKNDEFPFHTITDICVDPSMLRKGYAILLHDHVLRKHPNLEWRCHIDHRNENALRFFKKRGWIVLGQEEEMITFQFIAKA